MSSFIWIIVLVVVLAFFFILFWVADIFIKSKKTNTVSTKTEKTVREEKEEYTDIKNKLEDIEKLEKQIIEEVDASIAETNTKTAGITPAAVSRNRINKQRINNYYEKRWKSNNPASYTIEAPESLETSDESDTEITQEDIKKLLVLKDLFNRKT